MPSLNRETFSMLPSESANVAAPDLVLPAAHATALAPLRPPKGLSASELEGFVAKEHTVPEFVEAEINLAACPNVLFEGRNYPVPDVCMGFSVPGTYSVGTGGPYTYRVTGWLQRRPLDLKPPVDCDELEKAFFEEMWAKEYREPETEYRLFHCKREDATHVSGYGIGGTIQALNEIEFTGDYVKWAPERIEEERQRALRHVGQKVDHKFSTLPWQNITLAEAMKKLPALKDALAKEDDAFYIYVNEHTVRGHQKASEWEKSRGRGGPEHIWVQIAKRDEVPAFAREQADAP